MERRGKVFALMVDRSPRSADSPVDRLSVVREWLWRHSSQPNGDPWDGDPEHLDCAAQTLLDELARQLLGTDSPTSAAGQDTALVRDHRDVDPSAPALVPQPRLPGAGEEAVAGAQRTGVGSGYRAVAARAVALLTSGAMAGVELGFRGWGRVRRVGGRWGCGLEGAEAAVA